jgi:hypothetical protein
LGHGDNNCVKVVGLLIPTYVMLELSFFNCPFLCEILRFS